jgi:DNA-binding Lrp family transcriptional regulator
MTRYQLDSTDAAIIEILRDDGRAPLAKIGDAVGLSADAVRVRLARLTSDGVVRVIGIVHPSSLGYGALSVVVIDYSGPLHELAEELRHYPEVTFMALLLGNYNVMCEVAARDDQALSDFVNNVMRRIEHVDRIECWRTLEVVKWAIQGRPPPPGTAADVFEERFSLDELDIEILKVLTDKPRLTYRELQERVSAPYSIVRRRAQWLFQSKAIVATAIVDTVTTTNPRIMAQICLQLGPGAGAALTKLSDADEVHIAIKVSGVYNALLEVSCDSHEHLAAFMEQVLNLPAVRQATCLLVTHYSILPMPWALAGHTAGTRSKNGADGRATVFEPTTRRRTSKTSGGGRRAPRPVS